MLRSKDGGLDWLLRSCGDLLGSSCDVLLLAGLFDQFLGLLEEFKLGELLLEELESENLVDTGEDEEKHDWAHIVEFGPILNGILFVGLDGGAVLVVTESGFDSDSAHVEVWSVDSIHFSSEVEGLVISVGHFVIKISGIVVSHLLGMLLSWGVVASRVVSGSSLELRLSLVEHALLLTIEVVEVVGKALSGSQVSLGGLNEIVN